MTRRTPRHTIWHPTTEEVQAILEELRPLLHGIEPKAPLDGWTVEAADEEIVS